MIEALPGRSSAAGERIGLVDPAAVGAADVELVAVAEHCRRDEPGPHAAVTTAVQEGAGPAVELSRHGHGRRVGCPHGRLAADHAGGRSRVDAESVGESRVGTGVEGRHVAVVQVGLDAGRPRTALRRAPGIDVRQHRTGVASPTHAGAEIGDRREGAEPPELAAHLTGHVEPPVVERQVLVGHHDDVGVAHGQLAEQVVADGGRVGCGPVGSGPEPLGMPRRQRREVVGVEGGDGLGGNGPPEPEG